MQKLNKKSGFTLIEVLCSLSVLCIFFSIVISIELSNLKLKNYNDKKIKYLSAVEALRQEIMYNYTYGDVRQIYFENKRFINKEKLTINCIKDSQLKDLFIENKNIDDTYLAINIIDGEVLKIQLELNLKSNSKIEVYKYEFLKGNYL